MHEKTRLARVIFSLFLPDFQALYSIKNSLKGIRRRGAETPGNRDHKNR
jgi:hypothetical protein